MLIKSLLDLLTFRPLTEVNQAKSLQNSYGGNNSKVTYPHQLSMVHHVSFVMIYPNLNLILALLVFNADLLMRFIKQKAYKPLTEATTAN